MPHDIFSLFFYSYCLFFLWIPTHRNKYSTITPEESKKKPNEKNAPREHTHTYIHVHTYTPGDRQEFLFCEFRSNQKRNTKCRSINKWIEGMRCWIPLLCCPCSYIKPHKKKIVSYFQPKSPKHILATLYKSRQTENQVIAWTNSSQFSHTPESS